jgi:hypothetical protein
MLVRTDRFRTIRHPGRDDAQLEAHAGQTAEGIGRVRRVGAEAHQHVARALERFALAIAAARHRRGRPLRDATDQEEAHRIGVVPGFETRIVTRAGLELRIDAQPLEELDHLGAVDEVPRRREVEALLAAAVFRPPALDLRVHLTREIGLVVHRPFA